MVNPGSGAVYSAVTTDAGLNVEFVDGGPLVRLSSDEVGVKTLVWQVVNDADQGDSATLQINFAENLPPVVQKWYEVRIFLEEGDDHALIAIPNVYDPEGYSFTSQVVEEAGETADYADVTIHVGTLSFDYTYHQDELEDLKKNGRDAFQFRVTDEHGVISHAETGNVMVVLTDSAADISRRYGAVYIANPDILSHDPVVYATGDQRMYVNEIAVPGFPAMTRRRSYSNRELNIPGLQGFGWSADGLPSIGLIDVVPSEPYYLVDMGVGEKQVFIIDGDEYQTTQGQLELLEDYLGDLVYVRIDGTALIFHRPDDDSIPAAQRGQVKAFIDANGHQAEALYDVAGQLDRIERSFVDVDGRSVVEILDYDWDANGQIDAISHLVAKDAQAAVLLRRADYHYYDGTLDDFGEAQCLKLVEIEDGSGNVLDTYYYRYYREGDAGGFTYGLKYVLSSPNYERMQAAGFDPLTASDADIADYAQKYFVYDNLRRVVSQTLRSNEVDGSGTITFQYIKSGNDKGVNNWHTKTIETLADGDTQNIVYTNHLDQIMLKVRTSISDPTKQWIDYYFYDDDVRAIFDASPAAMTGFDENLPDLVGMDTSTMQSPYIRDDAGLINRRSYYASTTATETTPGAAAGRLATVSVQEGDHGDEVLMKTLTYYAHSNATE